MTTTENAADAIINSVREAERNLNDERERIAGKLFPDTLEDLRAGRPEFWEWYENVLFAVRDAKQTADAQAHGSLLRLLDPIVKTVENAIRATRRQVNGFEGPGTTLNLFLRALNDLHRQCDALQSAPQPPVIESPRRMMEKLNGPGDSPDKWGSFISAQWRHIDSRRISAILNGDGPDLTAAEVAAHPELIAWRAKQAEVPIIDDSLLQSECTFIACSRKQRAADPSMLSALESATV